MLPRVVRRSSASIRNESNRFTHPLGRHTNINYRILICHLFDLSDFALILLLYDLFYCGCFRTARDWRETGMFLHKRVKICFIRLSCEFVLTIKVL